MISSNLDTNDGDLSPRNAQSGEGRGRGRVGTERSHGVGAAEAAEREQR